MNELEIFGQIEAIILDVDGVLTDGTLWATESGELMRRFQVKDGYAIKQAIKAGLLVAIISGGTAKGTRKRLEQLGVKEIWLDEKDKMIRYKKLVEQYDLDEGKIIYMGDDLPDYLVMRRVGLPACPVDAAPELIDIAQYISPRKGGDGCVRDVLEKVLRIQQHWPYQEI